METHETRVASLHSYGADYPARSKFFVDDQNNSTRRYTYLKFVWETMGGEEELLVNISKLHMEGRYKTPQLQFSEPFAKAMQWLSPDGQSLGPNLRIEYPNHTFSNNFTLQREDLVKNQVFNPVLRTFTGGEACLWLMQNGVLMLIQSVNWRFIHLNDSFHQMQMHPQRALHDAALSMIVGNQMENLLSVINFEGQGKGTVFFGPQQVQYHPIKNDFMEMLEFKISDTDGVPVRFEKGRTVVTLHFKRE